MLRIVDGIANTIAYDNTTSIVAGESWYSSCPEMNIHVLMITIGNHRSIKIMATSTLSAIAQRFFNSAKTDTITKKIHRANITARGML